MPPCAELEPWSPWANSISTYRMYHQNAGLDVEKAEADRQLLIAVDRASITPPECRRRPVPRPKATMSGKGTHDQFVRLIPTPNSGLL